MAATNEPTHTEPPPPRTVQGPDRRMEWAQSLLNRYMLIIVLLAMVLFFSVRLPSTFPTIGNLGTITSTQAVLIIAAIGLTFPLTVGEFDLSFGAVIGFSSSLLAVLTVNSGWPLIPAMGMVLAVGVLIGLINAFFIVVIGVNSLVTTLGTGTLLTGLTLAVSNNQVIAGAPQVWVNLTSNTFLDLPYPVYFSTFLVVLAWYVYEYTPLGRYLYFTGEGRAVARLSGLRVDLIRTVAFVIVAVMSSIGGIINFGRLGSADPNIGATFLLPAFAAVFLGATAIKPGRYNAWGTLVAVYVLVVGVTGLELLGGAGWLEQIFDGSALVLSVTFAQLVQRTRSQ